MRRALLLLLVACGSSGRGVTSTGAPEAAVIVATAGDPEFGSSPAPLPRWTWAEYQRETEAYASYLTRLTQPHPRASATARYGINLASGDGNASWVLDGDAAAGYWLAVDLDHDGELADDPIWPLRAGAGGWRVEVTAPRASGAPLRYQVAFDGASLISYQDAVRTGTVALPGGTLRFAISCPFADCTNVDWVQLGFDLDGDGAVDLASNGSAERFRPSDGGLVAFGASYDVALTSDGERLEFRRSATPRAPRPSLAVGTVAPPLAFAGFELAEQRGHVVLIDFFSAGCPHCIDDLPWLDDLHAARGADGLRIVTVAVESAPRTRPWPTVVEELAGPITSLYRVTAYPAYFVLDRDGVIACARCVRADAERTLDRLLAR